MSWPLKKIGEHLSILSGFAFKSSLFGDSGMPLIRIRDVLSGSSETYYSGEYASQYIVKKGDLLVGMDGDFNRGLWNSEDALLNQRVCKLTADNKGLDQRFLYHLLPNELLKIHRNTPAVTVKHLSVKKINDIEIPLPPLEEQKRIAAILDKADAIRRKRQQAIQLADDFLSSYYFDRGLEAIQVNFPAEKLQPKKGWNWVKLTDVARLESGHTPSRRVPEYWGGEVQWLSLKDIKNINGLYIETTNDNPTELGIENSSARILPKGTVALCRTASVGKCVILGTDMSTSQDFVNWVCGEHLMPEFLLSILKCSMGEFDKLKQGSTHKTIYMPVLKELHILLPPISVQEEFVNTLKLVSKQAQNYEKQHWEVNELSNSLSQKAFAGEL